MRHLVYGRVYGAARIGRHFRATLRVFQVHSKRLKVGCCVRHAPRKGHMRPAAKSHGLNSHPTFKRLHGALDGGVPECISRAVALLLPICIIDAGAYVYEQNQSDGTAEHVNTSRVRAGRRPGLLRVPRAPPCPERES